MGRQSPVDGATGAARARRGGAYIHRAFLLCLGAYFARLIVIIVIFFNLFTKSNMHMDINAVVTFVVIVANILV
jgi:hypothetical protein